MDKEKVLARTEVERGIYRCNACANEHEVREDREELPPCSVCDSISWRRLRPAKDSGVKRDQKDG